MEEIRKECIDILKEAEVYLFSNIHFVPRWNNRYELLVGKCMDDGKNCNIYFQYICIAYGKYWDEAPDRKSAESILETIKKAFTDKGWIISDSRRLNSGRISR